MYIRCMLVEGIIIEGTVSAAKLYADTLKPRKELIKQVRGLLNMIADDQAASNLMRTLAGYEREIAAEERLKTVYRTMLMDAVQSHNDKCRMHGMQGNLKLEERTQPEGVTVIRISSNEFEMEHRISWFEGEERLLAAKEEVYKTMLRDLLSRLIYAEVANKRLEDKITHFKETMRSEINNLDY